MECLMALTRFQPVAFDLWRVCHNLKFQRARQSKTEMTVIIFYQLMKWLALVVVVVVVEEEEEERMEDIFQ